MPADAGEKTEAPTPRRLEESREEGKVAKSQDLGAALGLLAGLFLLNIYGSTMIKGFMGILRESLTVHHAPVSSQIALEEGWRMVARYSWGILGPFFLVLVVVAIVANLMQVGFMLVSKPIMPSFEKISPLAGIKRLFSLRSAMRLVMSLSKVIIIGLVAYFTIKSFLPELVGLAGAGYLDVVSRGSHLVFVLGIRMGLVLLLLALLDYIYQKFQMNQDLRMTKQEVKEEFKRMEGDPLMRQRRRSVARELAAQRMSQAVPKADVVITNPTHLAIALKYDPKEMPAPKVVARGAGYVAQRIREIAMENDVPIMERKPLARALYKSCDVGDFVPPELYKAMAEVLAYVFELAGKGFKKSVAG
ncbi:MAG: flagellar biosynthesis protein FlhB [Phycisphaerae bacterium]|nr:flagellar biosynthesis protein FlhB [Phycisphaerae bacterium]